MSTLKVGWGDEEHPLKIGDIEIPCYVLSNKQRVISQGGMVRSLSMKPGSGGTKGGGDRLVAFVKGNRINPFISKELEIMIENPVKFIGPNGRPTFGYDGSVLAGICEAVIKADADPNTKFQEQQKTIVERCKILYAGFARVGIIALIDEVTGYQKDRKEDELRAILEAYVNPAFLPWTRMFQTGFYEQLFRLRNLPFDPKSMKRPKYLGRITDDIVYKRLPTGVLAELKKLNPKNDKGNRPRKHHQHLTQEIGNPHLRSHLVAVTALMKVAPSWRRFMGMLERAFPRSNQIEWEGYGFDPKEEPEDDG
jgi:hypothetical protein